MIWLMVAPFFTGDAIEIISYMDPESFQERFQQIRERILGEIGSYGRNNWMMRNLIKLYMGALYGSSIWELYMGALYGSSIWEL